MTELGKDIIKELFNGGSVAKCGLSAWRLRDHKQNPLKTFTEPTWRWVKKCCRKDKRGFWVIDLRFVRKLHGNHWAKKYYKTTRFKIGKERKTEEVQTGTAAISD